MGRVIEALGSGLVVYVMVVACSSGGGGSGSHAGGGAGGAAGVATGGGSGGTTGGGTTGAGGLLDAAEDIIDALTDPVPDAMANESGTRLRARRLVGADGSKQWVGWHDNKLNVDCGYARAADGLQHCMPAGSPGLTVYFTDASCTQPIGVSNPSPPCALKYGAVTRYGKDTCEVPTLTTELYAVGAAVATPSTVYSLQGTACISGGASPNLKYYALTAVSPSEFVLGTEQVD